MLLRKAGAEFIGTALLLIAVVGSGIAAQTLSATDTGLALLENAVATGAALAAIILALGSVSGSHLNPVVRESVGVQDVEAAVLHESRDAGQGVDHSLDARSHALQRRHPTRRGPGSGRPDQVEQVGALGLVELERTADRLEDIIRHAAGVAALEARVVLHADPRQQRDLLAPQTRHPRWRP